MFYIVAFSHRKVSYVRGELVCKISPHYVELRILIAGHNSRGDSDMCAASAAVAAVAATAASSACWATSCWALAACSILTL